LIDWHIRLLAALAWILAALLVRRTDWNPRSTGFWLVFGPALAIYLLYHPVVELAMRGQTPGKRYAGVRVVGRDGRDPGVRAILIRNTLRLVDSLPFGYAVGLVASVVTTDRVRLGDLLAGTRLVERTVGPGVQPAVASPAMRVGDPARRKLRS
jgi:uncharacterized RDD family membrane protein YckC